MKLRITDERARWIADHFRYPDGRVELNVSDLLADRDEMLATIASITNVADHAIATVDGLSRRLETAEAEIGRVKQAYHLNEWGISSTLAKALGYEEVDGLPTYGEHTSVTLATEAAAEIAKLKSSLSYYEGQTHHEAERCYGYTDRPKLDNFIRIIAKYAPKVRILEFGLADPDDKEKSREADSQFGRFTIWFSQRENNWRVCLPDQKLSKGPTTDTEDDAIAAAQADFERRVKECYE